MQSFCCAGRVVALLAIYFASSIGVVVAGKPVIEGDAELLDAIYTAQVASEAQFERGRLVAEVHDEWLDVLHSHSVVTVTWNGQNTYLEAKYHTETIKDPTAHNLMNPNVHIVDADKEVYDSQLIVIETAHIVCQYRPTKHSVTVEWRTGGVELMPIFNARPDELWTVNFRGNVPFSRSFDVNHPKAADRFVVRSIDDNNIVIERSRKGSIPSVSTISVDAGLRVIENTRTMDGRSPARVDRSHYEWEQLPAGTWVVRNMEETRSYPDIMDEPMGRFRVKLLDYDPNPAIPSDRFTVEGLKLPAGTRVTELRGSPPNLKQKNYTIGGNGEIPQDLLDSLADELNKSGFGNTPKDE